MRTDVTPSERQNQRRYVRLVPRLRLKQERENNVYQNSLNCIYLQNFLTASLNENFVRKYNESVISYSGRAAHRLRGNSSRVGKALRRAHHHKAT